MKQFALLLLLLLLSARTSYAASSRPFPLGAYTRAIHQIRLSLDPLSHQHGLPAGRFAPLQRQLRRLDSVRLPSGETIHTGTPDLAAWLGSDHVAVQQVTVEIDALDDALRTLPHRSIAPGRLAALDTVLQDPAFHSECAPVACVETWIWNLLARLLNSLNGAGEAGPAAYVIIGAVFLVAVAGLAVLIARRTMDRAALTGAQLSDSRSPHMTSRSLEDEARKAAETGDYRNAMRCLFLAAILILQEYGYLELHPGRTNREYLQLLKRAAGERGTKPEALHPLLQQLVEQFECVWYGHHPLDAAGFAHFQRLTGEVRALAGQRAA